MLPVTMLKIRVKASMTTMSVGEPTATVTRKAIPVVMKLPMYGMKPPKKDSTASGSASGRPRTNMIANCVMAPNAEIAPVPSM